MIINSLLGQSNSQGSLLITVLLDLCSLVLEPDLQLSLIQTKFRTEILPSLLCQVLVSKELSLKSLQLFSVESGSWFLLCAVWLTIAVSLPLSMSSCSSTRRSVRVSGGKHPGGDVGEVGQRLGGHVGGVGGVGQVHGKLITLWFSFDDGFDGRCHWRCRVTSKIRTKNVIDGEWQVAAGAGAVRGEWNFGIGRATASLWDKILLSLFLLELIITDECIHDDDLVLRCLLCECQEATDWPLGWPALYSWLASWPAHSRTAADPNLLRIRVLRYGIWSNWIWCLL